MADYETTFGDYGIGTVFLASLGGPNPSGPTVHYLLAAVDSGAGRRSWQSTAPDMSQAPAPVGTWDAGTLTILATWS